MGEPSSENRVGWGSWLARLSLAVLLFEIITGLAVTLGRFHAVIEWGLLAHTVIGVGADTAAVSSERTPRGPCPGSRSGPPNLITGGVFPLVSSSSAVISQPGLK